MTKAYYTEDLTGRGENLFAFERAFNRELALATKTPSGWLVESSPLLPKGLGIGEFKMAKYVKSDADMRLTIAGIAEAALDHLVAVENSLRLH